MSTRPFRPAPNSMKHEPLPVWVPASSLPRICPISVVASARAAPSANTPALGVPCVATSPMA